MFIGLVKALTIVAAAVQAAVCGTVAAALTLVVLTSFGVIPMPI